MTSLTVSSELFVKVQRLTTTAADDDDDDDNDTNGVENGILNIRQRATAQGGSSISRIYKRC